MRRTLSIRQRRQEKTHDLRRILHGDVELACKGGHPYAVIALIPQHLPGEEIDQFLRSSSEYLREFVRGDDSAGVIADGVFAVGLHDAEDSSARVAAHRIQSDLGLRTRHLRNTIWETGYACLPEDGLTADQLVGAAIDSARTRRMRNSAW